MATDIELSTGQHTVKWSKTGYDDLIATINVTDTGVTCVSVDVPGGACYSSTAPGVTIPSSFTVVGHLKKTTGAPGVCSWITNKGGPSKLTSYDITQLILAYIKIGDVGFTVTTAHITGCILYYLGRTSVGNTMTGCSF